MPGIRDRRSDGDRASIGFQAFVMLAVIPKVACAMPGQGRLGGAPRRQNGSMARRPSKRCYVDTIAAVRRLSGNDGFATGQSCAGSIDYRRAWQFENESRLHRLDAMAARSRRECNDYSGLGWLATALFAASYLAKRSATLGQIQASAPCLWIFRGIANWRSSGDRRKCHRGRCRAILAVPAHTKGSRTRDLLG